MKRLPMFLIALMLARIAPATTPHPATTQSLEPQLAQHKKEQQQEYLSQISSAPELKLPNGAISDNFQPFEMHMYRV